MVQLAHSFERSDSAWLKMDFSVDLSHVFIVLVVSLEGADVALCIHIQHGVVARDFLLLYCAKSVIPLWLDHLRRT